MTLRRYYLSGRFRGREVAHKDLAQKTLNQLCDECGQLAWYVDEFSFLILCISNVYVYACFDAS